MVVYKVLKFFFKIYHFVQVELLRIFVLCLSKKMDVSHGFERTLIVSPHPDDEVFGCGGLMQTLIQSGKHVELVILSRGEAVHKCCCPNEEEIIMSARAKLTDAANGILGLPVGRIHRLDFPDGDFISARNRTELFVALGKLVEDISPTTVLIPHPYENSPDHEAATNFMENILRGSSIPLCYYCVWTWYHMPMYKILRLRYKNARLLQVGDRESKNRAIDIYIKNQARCGISYSGDLPKPFIHAFRWKYELFFLK